jgi:hypothetical protein
VTKEGNYYMAEIDEKLGGECKMIKHTTLIKDERA